LIVLTARLNEQSLKAVRSAEGFGMNAALKQSFLSTLYSPSEAVENLSGRRRPKYYLIKQQL